MNLIEKLTKAELEYQSNSINLIASENYPSLKVSALQGNIWNNKYGEGYPGKRYYAGNINTDQLESEVMNLCLQVFDCKDRYGVNVQCLSGSPANSTVYLACLNPGDTIMSMDLANGGHLSHLHSTSNWNKFFKHVSYNIDEHLNIDINDYISKLEQYRPNLVIIGFSSYPLSYEFKEMIKLAHSYGALVLCDIAHISGLVATNNHPSPFVGNDDECADFVTTTTHKTFRGPRGALIFAKNSIPTYVQLTASPIQMINKTIFPGTSGGPHFSTIAAIGQACYEILDSDPDSNHFKTYIENVLANIRSLEKGLIKEGIKLVTKSSNHLTLIHLPDSLDSLVIQQKLESYGIMTNRNLIPFDTKSAWRPSGLRLGTAAMTTRGVNSGDFELIGQYIGQIINNNLVEIDFNQFKAKLFKKINNPIT
jgi:glycine hydroxymethyltransferase